MTEFLFEDSIFNYIYYHSQIKYKRLYFQMLIALAYSSVMGALLLVLGVFVVINTHIRDYTPNFNIVIGKNINSDTIRNIG